MKVLVTGALGLVGSSACRFYIEQGHEVIGVDNNMRAKFFGKDASVLGNLIEHKRYLHYMTDIRSCRIIIRKELPDVVIHAAAQPSHDIAANMPIEDFEINAMATLQILEWCREAVPDCVFILVSTNKVYGDAINHYALEETETRFVSKLFPNGVPEEFPIDQSTHSLFGASKLSADIYAQEYGRYFGMKTGIFRCGCITGSRHAGAEQHGFLAYLVKCYKEKRRYKIYGYQGKQIRDNIHANDLVCAFDFFIASPRPGEVYNMGGGNAINISVIEAVNALGIKHDYIDEPRIGDHKWWISDVRKFKKHYPKWQYSYSMEDIFENLISA